MKKVLLVANTDWYLYNFRLSFAQYLREQGIEVLFCTPEGRYTAEMKRQGFRCIRLELSRKSLLPWNELASLFQLIRIYRQERVDLVHHHTLKPVLYGSLAARLVRVPIVVNSVTGRGYVFMGEDWRASVIRKPVRMLLRTALAASNCAVIFENEHDRQYYIDTKLIKNERTWLIEGVGVNINRFVPTPEPPGQVVILMASRMLWDKGVGVLVEAARLLRQKVSVKMVLAGEPDPGNPSSVDERILQDWNKEGIIDWLGWREDMVQVYSMSHVVTLPSMYEGVPTTLLEAAACGQPIVATDIPGCRSVVNHGVNGYLVAPNNPMELADALERLVKDPLLRERMGKAGRSLILEKYTDACVNEATLAVYRTMLKP